MTVNQLSVDVFARDGYCRANNYCFCFEGVVFLEMNGLFDECVPTKNNM